MEWYWILLGTGVVLLGSFIGGIVAQIIWMGLTDKRMKNLETDIFSLEQTIKSRAAVAAKEEQKEAMGLAMAQAAQLLQSDDPDKMKKIGALAAANPDIAMKLIKKLGIGL